MFIYALKKIGIFLALLVGLLVLRFCGDVLERVNDRSIGMSSLLGQAQAQPLDPGTAKWADLGTWQVYGSTRTRNCTMIARYDTMHMAVTFSQQDAALVFLNVPATKVDVGNTTHHFIAMMGGEANGQSGVFEAIIPKKGIVAFRNLNPVTLHLLGTADEIAVEDIGRFSLFGADKAIRSALDCFFTLNTH